MLYIRDHWAIQINPNVNYSQLMNVLNRMLASGIDSKYILFTYKYIIKNQLNLNYPNGLKYFLDKPEIKEAYKKTQLKPVKMSSDIKADFSKDTKFTYKPYKRGFGQILGGGKL